MASKKKSYPGRKYGKAAGKSVAARCIAKKEGTLRSGKGGKGGCGEKPQAGNCHRPFWKGAEKGAGADP